MPDFRPVMKGEKFEDIPLHGRPEFKGGILESDQPFREEDMNVETKEIVSAPNTENKDTEVKSGAQQAPKPGEHIGPPVSGNKDGEIKR